MALNTDPLGSALNETAGPPDVYNLIRSYLPIGSPRGEPATGRRSTLTRIRHPSSISAAHCKDGDNNDGRDNQKADSHEPS
jgi:hypothetical protein